MADVQQCLDGLEDERTIFRVVHDRNNPYIVVAKATELDERFRGTDGLMAGMLLNKMLCMPDDWEFNIPHLTKLCGIGKNLVAELLRLLVEWGYVARGQGRRHSGRFGRARYLVYERPVQRPNGSESEVSTVSLSTGDGGTVDGDTGDRSHRVRSHRCPAEPYTVKRAQQSTERSSSSPPGTEYGGDQGAPPPAVPPDPDEGRLASSIPAVVESLREEYRAARGRHMSLDGVGRAHVGELVTAYGAEAVVRAFRRALRSRPPSKTAFQLVQDLEPETPRPTPPARASPPEADPDLGPLATPEDWQEALADVGLQLAEARP